MQRMAMRSPDGMYDRDSMVPAVRFDGPALVTQLDARTYVRGGWRAHVDGYGNLFVEK